VRFEKGGEISKWEWERSLGEWGLLHEPLGEGGGARRRGGVKIEMGGWDRKTSQLVTGKKYFP